MVSDFEGTCLGDPHCLRVDNFSYVFFLSNKSICESNVVGKVTAQLFPQVQVVAMSMHHNRHMYLNPLDTYRNVMRI